MASRPKADPVRINVRSIEGADLEIEPPSDVTHVRLLIEPDKTGVVVRFSYAGGAILVHLPSAVFLQALRESINLSSELDSEVGDIAQEELRTALDAILHRRRKSPG